MRSITLIIVFTLLLIKLAGCQTVKNKTDEIVKKENQKLSQFIGQPVSELKIVMGLPYKEERSDTGTKVLYIKQKNMEFSVKENLKLVIMVW